MAVNLTVMEYSPTRRAGQAVVIAEHHYMRVSDGSEALYIQEGRIEPVKGEAIDPGEAPSWFWRCLWDQDRRRPMVQPEALATVGGMALLKRAQELLSR